MAAYGIFCDLDRCPLYGRFRGQSRHQPRSQIPADQLIARRVGNGRPGRLHRAASYNCRRNAPIARSPSIQFRWLIILALGPGHRVDARPQARETCVGLRSRSANICRLQVSTLARISSARASTPPTTSIISLRKASNSPRNRPISRSHFSQRLSRSPMRHRAILLRPGTAQTARASSAAGHSCRRSSPA